MGSKSSAPETAPFSLLGVGRIPLRNRHGQVVAYATVDLADFRRINRHRWFMRKEGYVYRNITLPSGVQRSLALHREVMGLGYGDANEVDHVRPADKRDCRRSNLRVVTRAQNAQNLPPYEGKSSRHRGVSFSRSHRRWLAQAKCGGKRLYRSFHTEEEAHAAVVAWRKEHMPFSTI